ncbi:MAG TPA: hypothetical protein VN838_21350 [Bradyrhizobium sp.]|nr:hypothetical protein [Bradyrhizobium sp.]
MRNYIAALTAIATTILASPTASADPAGTAFCSQLLTQAKANPPVANKIYVAGRGGVITQLQNGAELGRGQTDLYFYRYRVSDATNRAGAIAVKIKYLRPSNQTQDQVTLFNSRKTVQARCKVTDIERYERFHGASEEPNTCIKRSFHQGDPPFNTLDPVSRRREFAFGAPGLDTSGIGAAIWRVANPFDYTSPEKLFARGANPASPQTSTMSYRSQIYNYSGEGQAGSCIRFVLLSDGADLSANIVVTDLLGTEQNEYIRATANVRFVGN